MSADPQAVPRATSASTREGSDSDQFVASSLPNPPIFRTVNGVPQLSRKFVARRISEGETGRLKEELKCQACGKGYKHVSSLAKHLWEHTPEWSMTSKLLISKHQQVQLLEAASILVSMNEEDEKSDEETATPAAPVAGSATATSSQNVSLLTPGPEDSPSPVEIAPTTPHKDIPLTTARSISKTSILATKGRGRRVSLSSSLGTSPAVASTLISMAAQASPFPESVVKDWERNPPHNRARAGSMATRHNDDDDDDDLQEPSNRESPPSGGDVFGDMDE
ncbi:hypothetical protein B9G98_00279 [Wickerhamiella sorbophila]|uniref:C2H2-type domain-containing protein n=1 Tax=Wickerhamiella sorbophila TaxID=45607 RepID=A0A2T0FCJ8_9ASCO|nr:hypothetical protein B9G98_00279 [Wickerhamiella sorbophila]PRT52659.1 hypothetical protein B9G98_00279 [Wickerhamiella sorbophila]